MLAIATHGRSGIQRWIIGSIAERVLDGSRLPLLIVRPPQVVSTSSPEEEATH
ncbi:MAG: universal stress protein [Ktedonobacteraceae bacterium]